ncbi:hypothetical protein CRUP_005576 [Coryphaenoides rupestris]|nr:hypothetical protein CRUP_005576 [Coryphaenoides rupestris]
MDHFDFGLLLDRLSHLEELWLVYGDGGKALEEGMSHNTSVTEWDVRLTGAMGRVVQSNQARAHQQGAPEHLANTK